MPKKKARKTTRRKSAAKAQPFPPVRFTRRGLILTGQIVLFLALFVGGVIGVQRAQVATDRIARESPRTVRILWPNAAGLSADGESTWLPVRAQEQLVRYAQDIANEHAALTASDLAYLQSRLSLTGWFVGDDPRVELVGTDEMRVSGRWKLPAAVVRSEGNDHLISWDRQIMPMVYPAGESSEIVILNARLAPTTADPIERRRSIWPGDDVAWAVDLIGLLHPEPFIQQVAAIDVADTSGPNPTISILTTDGGVIEWGRPPGVWTAGEVDDDLKLQRLRDLHAETGAIDAGSDLLDIAGAHVVRKRPRTD